MNSVPFEVLVDRAPFSVIVVSGDGTIEYVNTSCIDLLGYRAQELLGQSIEILVPPEVRSHHAGLRLDFMKEPLQRRMGAGRDLVVIGNGNRRIPVEIGLSPITLGDRALVAVHLIDITSRLAQQEVNERHSRLESVGFLAGGMAHDFNNILSAIAGNADLASLDPSLAENTLKRLETIRSLVRRGSELARRLITFSKGGQPVFQLTDIARVLEESATNMTTGTSVAVEYDLDPHLWPAYIDETQIGQVLSNLVINSVQALAQGGKVTITARNAELFASGRQGKLPPGRYVRIDVADNGPGIPEDIRPKVFDPFFTTKSAGTGLGLAMCHSIIDRHKGLITLSSEEGDGTVFEIYLPAAGVGVRSHESENEVRRLSSCAESGSVLVLDDDNHVRAPIVAYLKNCGFATAEASDGEQALARIDEGLKSGNRFDIGVFDMTIPGKMGGVEAAKLAKERDPNLIIVIMSGYSHESVGPLLQGVADEFLPKPFRSQELVDILHRLACDTD